MRWKDIILLGAGMVLGGVLFRATSGQAEQDTKPNRFQKLDIFASVLSYIENDYVDPIDGKTLIYGAIQGMVGKLDPYTVFIPPEQYREMKAETSGEHGGVGLEITRRDSRIYVISPLPDSPSQKAGIWVGDEILQVEDKLVQNQSLYDIRRWLRGRPGSRLRLLIQRPRQAKPQWFVMIREQIRVQSVYSRTLDTGYYYVRIKSFQDRTERQFKAALQGFQKQGAIRGLVLDLRNNPGGLFDQSVRVADLFLHKGIIVVAKGRTERRVEKELAHEKGTWLGFPIVTLINKGTASAAEIVAGALQDHRRSLILGTTSFGKGSVQTIIDLSDGSGLKMTIARYHTPSGRLIHGLGIQPDVSVSRSSGQDQQLDSALRFLRQPKPYEKHLGRGLIPPKKS